MRRKSLIGSWMLLILFVFSISSTKGIVRANEPATDSLSQTADDSQSTQADLRQLFVPKNRPQDWPKGNWEILENAEYERLLNGIKPKTPKPAAVVIPRASYQAIFTGEHLRGGRLALDVQRTASNPKRQLSMDLANLAITSLWWEHERFPEKPDAQKAVWGNTAGGQTLCLLPETSATQSRFTLKGEWSAAGQHFSDRVEFDLQFAPAAVTELELYLPQTWTLNSSVGHVTGPLPISDKTDSKHEFQDNLANIDPDGFRAWRVKLGSEQACQLNLQQTQSEQVANPLVMVESDTTYLIRERELQIEARYDLNIAFAPITELVFNVPRAIRVYGVTYGGDANLAWQVKPGGNQQQVVIALPDPLLGQSRPIRIQGLAPVLAGRPWRLPQLRCYGASILRGEVHLTVEDPLVLRSFEAEGYRQTAISVHPGQRETLTFSQTAANANFMAFLGTPAFSMSAQVISHLTTGTEDWQMRTEVTWESQAGSRFVQICEIAKGWEILDVRKASESAPSLIADWRLSDPGEPARLTIEFLEALTPMQSKRVQILARRLPLTSEQTLPLSCVVPLSCRSVDQFLAVFSPKGGLFSTEPESGISRVNGDQFPAFLKTSPLLPLLKPMTRTAASQYFFSTKHVPDSGLILNHSKATFDATAAVKITGTDSELREEWILTIAPHASAVDRVTIFSADSLEGTDWEWQIQFGQEAPQKTAPPMRVAEAPDAWEWRLPQSQTHPFQLIGKRTVPASNRHQLDLPFLPLAEEFQGSLEFACHSKLPFDVQAEQVQEVSMSEEPAEPGKSLRRWEYQTALARIDLQRQQEEANAAALLGRLTVLSLINGDRQANTHRAQFKLEPHSRRQAFTFQLPDSVELVEVRLNAQAISGEFQKTGLRLPPHQKNVIEIFYQSPWNSNAISPDCQIPIPQTNAAIVNVVWRFGLSPNLRLSAAPTGMVLSTPLASPHWTTRFFGPLGRGANQEPFRPWLANDWKSLFTADSPIAPLALSEADQNFFPRGWIIYEAHGPEAGAALQLSIWNHSAGLRSALLAFLISLGIGFFLRIASHSYRRQIGVFWFLLSFSGASWLPMPWAMISGGCFIGTLIAFLFPRRMLFRQKPKRKKTNPLGSTASFAHHPVITLLLILGLGIAVWSFAVPSSSRSAFGQEPAAAGVTTNNLLTGGYHAMIPVTDPKDPNTRGDVVYVDREFLVRLRKAQPKPVLPESYLISSANYEANVESQGAVEIFATYEVTILTPAEPVKIVLPINNAYLGGPGHCLVDGVPHPVQSRMDNAGYVVELSPQLSKTIHQQDQPAIAEKSHVPKLTRPAHAKHQIQLRLHGTAAPLPSGGRFSLTLPRVSASVLQLALPERFASIAIRGEQGQHLAQSKGRTLSVPLGTNGKVEWLWSQQPNELPRSTKPQAEVLALATIHPLWVDWQIRVNMRPNSRMPSAMWSLPRSTIVKKVKADGLASHRVVNQSGASRLLMEFENPHTGKFTVDLHCLTPRTFSPRVPNGKVKLPALDLFREDSRKNNEMESTYTLGVASTPELAFGALDQALLTEDDRQPVSPEQFLTAYRQSATDTPAIRSPDYAWKLGQNREMELTLSPRLPTRKVWLHQEGQIHDRELKWLVTAEVETNRAAAFRHVLLVPANLQIDSVSVQEDETERLVRWTKSGSRLELVLSDGTTGIQNINLAGHLPLNVGEEKRVPLPLVSVEDAEIADSQLRIMEDLNARRTITLEGLEDWPRLEAGTGNISNGNLRLLESVRLPQNTKPPLLIAAPPLPQLIVDRMLLVEQIHESRHRITTRFRLSHPDQQPHRLQLHVPASLVREFRVSLRNPPQAIVPYETIPNPDQSLDLVFDSLVLQNQSVLQIEAMLDGPRLELWKPPLVQFVNGVVESRYLLVSPEFRVQVAEDVPFLSFTDLPDWVKPETNGADPAMPITAVENPPEDWKLLRNLDDLNEETPPELVLHTTLWLTDSQRIAGQTILQFPRGDLKELAWDWPLGTSLRGVLLDGIPLAAHQDAQGQTLSHSLLAPREETQDIPPMQTLELHWSRDLETGIPRFGQLQIDLPKPRQVSIPNANLTIIPSAQTRLIPNRGFQAEAPTEESLIGIPLDASLSGQLSGEEETWSVSLWTMDSRAETAFFLLILGMVLGGTLHWGLRFHTGDWLHAHPAIAFGFMGLVWWICLKGSLVGFGIFFITPLFALATKISHRNQTKTSDQG